MTGIADQRIESWFQPFGGTIATGYITADDWGQAATRVAAGNGLFPARSSSVPPPAAVGAGVPLGPGGDDIFPASRTAGGER